MHSLTLVACCVLGEVSSVVVLMLCLSEVHSGKTTLGSRPVLLKARYRSFGFHKLRPSEHVVRLTCFCLSRGIPSNFSALRGGRAEAHSCNVVSRCTA